MDWAAQKAMEKIVSCCDGCEFLRTAKQRDRKSECDWGNLSKI